MKIAPSNPTDNPFVSEIKQILEQARRKAYTAINTAMVNAYWLVNALWNKNKKESKEPFMANI